MQQFGLRPVDLASKLGVSRARVSQVLRLRRLAPEVKDLLMNLGDFLTWVPISERELRALVALSVTEQMMVIRSRIPL